jgi:hypothetical protein
MTGVFPLYLMFAEIIETWSVRPVWQRTVIGALIALTFAIQLAGVSVPLERQQVERVVYNAQGLGDYEHFNFFNWEWSPLNRQALATLNNLRNLPHYRDYLDSPASLAYPELLKHLFDYNLPDWWWLFKLLHGSEIAIVVPLAALLAALWLIAHLVSRDAVYG